MGFGAIIASGEKNQLLPDRLLDCITEVRVEQTLDYPTKFAIRFQEDIVMGKPLIMDEPELQCEQMITIAVAVGKLLKVLVRGQITYAQCSTQLGGAGSWYQIQGKDRRIELDRQFVQRCWNGRASDAAREILQKIYKDSQIEETTIVYGSPRENGCQVNETLNQRDTDNEFIYKIARQNNFHYWIEYKTEATGRSLKVMETVNLKSSPPRPQNAQPGTQLNRNNLVPTIEAKLRVNVEPNECQTVTAFMMNMNPERPNRYMGKALNVNNLQLEPIMVKNPQPPIPKKGKKLGDAIDEGNANIPSTSNPTKLRKGKKMGVTMEERDAIITSAGNQNEVQNKAESILNEAGWYICPKLSTTAYMLGDVLQPHDVVELEGLSKKHNGPYQVKAVTHVINAADHFMDIKLRRNAIGG